MSKLIESILDGDYVSANQLFEDRMIAIQERKLHEVKRDMQAEVFGGKTPAEVRASPGYRGRASDILGDPTAGRRKTFVSQPSGTEQEPTKPKKKPETAKAPPSEVKKLKPISRLSRGMEGYKKDLAQAQRLKARGHSQGDERISQVKKAYRGVRVKSALGNIAKGVGSFVAGALQSVEE